MRRWAAFRSTGYLPPLRWASDPVRHADGASLATASVCGLTSHSGAVVSWSAARWVGGPRKQLCPWHGKASPPQCAASHSKGSHWSHCPITGTAASPPRGCGTASAGLCAGPQRRGQVGIRERAVQPCGGCAAALLGGVACRMQRSGTARSVCAVCARRRRRPVGRGTEQRCAHDDPVRRRSGRVSRSPIPP